MDARSGHRVAGCSVDLLRQQIGTKSPDKVARVRVHQALLMLARNGKRGQFPCLLVGRDA